MKIFVIFCEEKCFASKIIILLLLLFADDLRIKEEKIQRLLADSKHTLESLAIILSTPSRFVDSVEAAIKERIHEILNDNQERSAVKLHKLYLIPFYEIINYTD